MARVTTKPKPKMSQGQALKALFGDANVGSREIASLRMIRRENIVVEAQVRRNVSSSSIQELRDNIVELRLHNVATIEDTGLLQPLVVSPIKGEENRFKLIAGGRRFLATGEWGDGPVLLPELPCIVLPASEQGAKVAQLVENIQRQDLPVADEALGLMDIKQATGLSIRDLAKLVGKSRHEIHNRVKLAAIIQDKDGKPTKIGEWLSVQTDNTEGATLTNILLIASVEDEAFQDELLKRAEKPLTKEELKALIDERTPKTDDEANETSRDFATTPNQTGQRGAGSATTFRGQAAPESGGSATTAIRPSEPAELNLRVSLTPKAGDETTRGPLKEFIWPATAILKNGADQLEAGAPLTQEEASTLEAAIKVLDEQTKRLKALKTLSAEPKNAPPET